jgi:hypothetical protein
MKNAYTLMLALWFSQAGIAQIDQADLPQEGMSIDMTDAGNATVDDNQTGNNQTWDFSSMADNGIIPDQFTSVGEANFTFLFAFGQNSSNPADFAMPGEIPIPQFVLSNLASLAGFAVDESFNFFRGEPSGLYQAGFGITTSGFGLPIPYSAPDEIIPIPLELNRQTSSNYTFNVELPGLGTWACTATRENVVDGNGILLLPNATYENVYRVKSVLNSDNTITVSSDVLPFPIPGGIEIPFPRNETKYMYFVEGTGWPVLEVKSSLLGSTAKYRSNPVDFTHVEALDAASIALYPNPASDMAQIRFEKKPAQSLLIELSDLNGKILFQKTVSTTGNTAIETIPVKALALTNGLYQVRLISDNAAPLVRKLVVQN